ncbi:MAG TPA: S8 family peptidase, partial [Anaerolineae bacterium]|nr:S8 family peptidase [Anaerolineae bacterium]
MFKHRVIVAVVVVMLIISLTGVGSILAQSGAGGFTATPLTPDSTDQVSKSDTPNGSQPSRSAVTPATTSADKVSVIVKLDVDSVASYDGGLAGLPATNPKAANTPSLDMSSANVKLYQAYVDNVQQDFQTSVAKTIPGAEVVNQYDLIFGGVSMVVPADQVSTLAKMPGVVAVYPDELLHLDTDNSPQFIGAPTAWNLGGGQENAGEGVVVGVLDTGIWPEHPSFSDPDPSGKPYAPLASWHGTTCQFGSAVPGDAPFTCNNKLVGAARFMATYSALNASLPDEYLSARDDDGHGTHTSSTAAGNANVAASIFGVPRGLISGIAPRARIAMYKVCGAAGCYSSDSAAAVQQAIQDGVNVINFSISGGANPYSDAVELAFLDAYNAGVFVSASAGNSGPGADTTDHRGPWVTTVAASTQNRAFQNTVTLTADGGASLSLTGASLTQGVGPAPVFVPTGSAANLQCDNPLAPGSVTGMVVICRRGNTGRAQKGYNVLQGGAVGMILYNQSTAVTDVETDNHYLPATHVQFNDGTALLTFIASHTNVQATLTQGVKVLAQGDVMASFSSRGGPGQSLGVSKPDITAPGVQVLAGASPQHLAPPAGVALGPQGELFQAIAGTSMSSPHIAGSGALIKWLHPDWTPGQIKSALMTTAWTQVVKEDGVTPATPFDDGSGRVDLSKAGTAGLTFDEIGANYVAFQSHLWDANYPSLYVPVMPGSITVKRTVHNETKKAKTYALTVTYPSTQPSDITVVVPKSLKLAGNGWALFDITVNAPTVPLGQVRYATVVFTSGSEQLHFPITIVRNQPVVTLTKSCDPLTIHKYDPKVGIVSTTTCNITMQNTSFSPATVSLYDRLPNQLKLVSVTGGSGFAYGVTFDGVL